MTDEHKMNHDLENLENLSPEELQEHIQEEKKNARRSLRFAFTALIAIIAVCIAWFVSNNQVTMTGTQISAESDEPFEIASVGSRQSSEKNYLLDENGKNILSSGMEKTYSKYVDTETGSEIDRRQTYYAGGSGVAWYMNGQGNLIPGSGGKLEFYLIAKKAGLSSVTVNLNLEGYALEANDTDNKKVKKLNDSRIQELLNGHILFFRHLDDTYGYYGWLGATPAITVKASDTGLDKTTFEKDIPYKVTIYWKWPQYFRNYVYTQRTRYGDLFTDEMIKEYPDEYEEFIKFVNDQKSIETGRLFYSQKADGAQNTDTTQISGDINAQMSDETLNLCNNYYNQADEYIGKNAQYAYIQIKVGTNTVK